jgi:hypothetical protein
MDLVNKFIETLESTVVGQFGDMISGIFEDLFNLVNGLDPFTQIGVLVLGTIIVILGTLSLIKKLSKIIIVVALVFLVWQVLQGNLL